MPSTKPTSASSISDLAPFVAAVLKDEVVTDLNKDIEELREIVDERLLVEITGRGGTPVHYQASLKDGRDYSYHPRDGVVEAWVVYFKSMKNDSSEDTVLPLDLVADLEVRLGGMIVFDMKYASTLFDGGPSVNNIEESHMGNIDFVDQEQSVCPLQYVCAKVGPMLHGEFFHFDLTDSVYMVTIANEYIQRPLNFNITGVVFNKEKIGSLLSVVERMGITNN